MRWLVLAALLAGCADEQIVWSKPGQQRGDFEADRARCTNQGLAIAGVNPYASVNQVAYNCMVGLGWRPRQGAAAPSFAAGHRAEHTR